MAKQAGHKVGYTTTEGIYIQDQVVHEGDCTGPVSSQAVLWDPTIDFAVLECARGGILRSGLGFDTCDISIVTNVTDDHFG
jgi:cyanophycin synthetase